MGCSWFHGNLHPTPSPSSNNFHRPVQGKTCAEKLGLVMDWCLFTGQGTNTNFSQTSAFSGLPAMKSPRWLVTDGKGTRKCLECVAIIIRPSGHTYPYIIYPHSTRSLSDIWSTLLASRLSCFHLHDLWKQHAWTCQTNPDLRWCRNDLKYHSSLITFLTTTTNPQVSQVYPSIL